MTTTYHYTAKRKADGVIIKTDTIMDPGDQGMGMAAAAVRSALASSHPAAVDLEPDDIDIEMSVVLPGS
ncbi:hypothetical protein SAMN04489859_10658 [Paracoccus alcaliphilus]|uniref:Uncharacterized protein n=1 Tax=Paracoccus alcaliphilus TaxID=34002 RepID=A0A1H8NML2_9RHOB|nr:hypothetical protein [Paracoccus alcaliphilus]WCR17488.1 hypothetical protein JHW40_14290 [Paracoccus alcaliphilus]SEO30816.1 hypothetical protein SAMN04489859_10658 [Paracoccus alcaliphilus]